VRAQRREEAVDFARRVLAPLLFPSAPQSAAEDGSEAHEYVHLVIGPAPRPPPIPLDTSRPPPRTKRTRLVLPPAASAPARRRTTRG
jgi:hypothetical protein